MNQGVGLRGVAKQGLGPRGVRRAVLGLSPWRRAARDTAGHARERAASKTQSMGGYWMGGTCEGNRVPGSSRGRPQGASRHLNLPGNVARRERKASGVAWKLDQRPLAVASGFSATWARAWPRPRFALSAVSPSSFVLQMSSRQPSQAAAGPSASHGDEACGAARTRS